MIDTKELRRLAQAATPGPWWVNQDGLNHGFERGVLEINANDWHALAGAWAINDEMPSEEGAANAAFIAAANPAAINELLDRLEAAESVLKDFGTTAQEVECWLERYRCIEREAEALRTRLEAAEADALEQARLNGLTRCDLWRDD